MKTVIVTKSDTKEPLAVIPLEDGEKAVMKTGYEFEIRETDDTTGEPLTRVQIGCLMQSADYKDRFRAEYWYVKTTHDRLTALLQKWDTGTLDFTPDCPRSIYDLQTAAMKDYITVLEARAAIERVKL